MCDRASIKNEKWTKRKKNYLHIEEENTANIES